MERLTNSEHSNEQRRDYEKRLRQGYPRNIPEERFLKLAHYEDLAEQGRLIELPCAVGDMVYRVNKGSTNHPIIPMEVTEVAIKNTEVNTSNSIKCKGVLYGGELEYKFSEIGETVFLTKEEAEKKLKEMESDNQ